MIRKRHILKEPEVKDYLVKGERFTKWKEVSIQSILVVLFFKPHVM